MSARWPDTQRTIDIDDPDDPGTTWRFDLRFMRSNYHCIWGQGCRSVRGDDSSQGCCSHGVYVEGADWDPSDRGEAAEIDARARTLTAAEARGDAVVLPLGGSEGAGAGVDLGGLAPVGRVPVRAFDVDAVAAAAL